MCSPLHQAPSVGCKLYLPAKMKLAHSWQRPLLDDFLRRIRLRACVCFRSEFRSPWGISIARRRAIFHVVQQGNCWLQIGNVAQPTRLSEGDVAVFPRGDTHTLRNEPSTPTVDFFGLVNGTGTGNEPRVFGGDGAVTRLLCVGAHFESGVSNPLAAMLPSVLLLKQSRQASTVSLALAAQQIVTEMDGGQAGAREAVTPTPAPPRPGSCTSRPTLLRGGSHPRPFPGAGRCSTATRSSAVCSTPKLRLSTGQSSTVGVTSRRWKCLSY